MSEENSKLGWLCAYTPEELIVASGLTPVRVRGEEGQAPVQFSHLPSNICPYVRSVLDRALRGEYHDLAGVSIVASCDAMRRLADVWRNNFPDTPLHVIDFPRRTGESSLVYLVTRYEAYRDWLGGITGIQADEVKLREAIGRVNKKRLLLLELSDRRKTDPPGIRGSEFFDILCRASSMAPAEFESWYSSISPAPAGPGARLLLTGSILESTRIYQVVEEAGANVVAEDICTGLRGLEGLVDPDGDPMRSVARRYLSRPPCSRMSDIEGRMDYLQRLVKDYTVHGVIYHCLKFCDQYQYDYPILKARLESQGVPVLRIETDYKESDSGQLSTRIEAFIELFEH
jgi:benzoyl-CoA reductase/2-hydroxyglutaryl-CoA dehydratase subunit BcrC/BadD/HgdB